MGGLTLGVFDSGLGGLSVLAPIRRSLPDASLLYVADSGHLPYGNKSDAYIQTRVLAISEFLLAQGAQALVVACNTATAAAVATIRARYSVPVIGMEPAIKPAVLHSQSGVIAVLATEFTVGSARFAALKARFDGQARILVQACPGLVELVEQGELQSETTRQLLQSYIEPLLAEGADRLVLGCTHYPFLKPLLNQLLPAGVQIVDTGEAVARELQRRVLADIGPLIANPSHYEAFWTSGMPAQLDRVLPFLWPTAVRFRVLPAFTEIT